MQPISKGPISTTREAPTAEAQDAKLREVGELYEKQFLRQMVKAMRSTVSESGLIQASQGEKIFKEQLDEQYVEKWGEKGGIGIADMIHQQLLEKYGVQMGIKKAEQIPHGPMKLSNKDFIKPMNLPSEKSNTTIYKLEPSTPQPATVTNPWSGKYLGDFNLSDSPDTHHLTIEHENGLRSTLSYNGTKLNLPTGTLLSSGQELGQTTQANPNLIWQIKPL